MRAYVVRQLVQLVVVVIGISVLSFCILHVLGDPVLLLLPQNAGKEEFERYRKLLGLDQPMPVQYWKFASRAVHGDFGKSWYSDTPAFGLVLERMPPTLYLTLAGLCVALIIALPLGFIAALRRHSVVDNACTVVAVAGQAMPIFWLGIMALLIFYAKLDWLPGPGRLDFGYEDIVTPVTGIMTIDTLIAGETDLFWNAVAHLILPASLLGYYSLAYISRMTRSLMLSQLRQEYVLTARVKGVPERRIIWKHAMGNVMVPLLTVVALSYGNLLEGSVLTETVFAWHGIGLYITDSIFGQDLPAVMGGTIVVGFVYIIINTLTDLAYRFLDPRAR